MRRRLGHRQHRCDARVAALEDLRPLRHRPLREPCGEHTPHLRPPCHVVLAGQIGGHPFRGEKQRGEPRVELRLKRPDGHVPSVRGLVHVVERRPGVQPVHAALVGPRPVGEQPVRHRLKHRGPVHDRGVDHLTVPGLAGAKQRGEHPDREEQRPAAEVAQVVHGDLRRAAGPADRVQRPGHGDVGDVMPGPRRERPSLAPPGHPPVHQPRVARPAGGGADAEPFGDPGPVSLEQRVAGRREPHDDLRAARVLEVNDDPPLPPARDVLVGRHRRRRPARAVHPDHFGAKVGEKHRTERPRPYPCQLDHAHPGEGPAAGVHHVCHEFHCREQLTRRSRTGPF